MQEIIVTLGEIQPILISVLIALILLVLVFQILWRYRPHLNKFQDLTSQFDYLQSMIQRSEDVLKQEVAQVRNDSINLARDSRNEIDSKLNVIEQSLLKHLTDNSMKDQNLLHNFSNQLQNVAQNSQDSNEKLRQTLELGFKSFQSEVTAKLDKILEDSNVYASRLRNEVQTTVQSFNESIRAGMSEISSHQKGQLETFSDNIAKLTISNEAKLEGMREIVEAKLKQIQEDNTKQIELMRNTVDEKLQGTLEKRLGESFKQVSERLEQVHKGLGEMQSLASGVGDLKRVLSNVRMRGTWGEVQLGAILEQMLAVEQFEKNVRIKQGSSEFVEYAIKLPGPDLDDNEVVWLPVDSKFPIEDYQRLVDAQERVDYLVMEEASNGLRSRIISSAKDISMKYLYPPDTTDFGIMFLPLESLYAEVLRQPGLVEELQIKYRVVVTGPTTFAALLNSLQMGFRTLKIQKQSSEVWKVLSSVKSEFGKFGSSIEAVKKKLQEASNKIDDVGVRTRAVERTLRKVEELPSSEEAVLLKISESSDDEIAEQDTSSDVTQ